MGADTGCRSGVWLVGTAATLLTRIDACMFNHASPGCSLLNTALTPAAQCSDSADRRGEQE
jgi:hypothetical protein